MKVRLPAAITKRAATIEVDVESCTLEELIEILARKVDESIKDVLIRDGDLNSFINVFVNGRNVRNLEGLRTKLKKGDEISFIPAVAGG